MSATNPAVVSATRRPNIRWPWIAVCVSWGAAGLAALTGQSYLVDHDYLIESGNLPLPVAMLVFVACWQVMIVAMMLPSSLPVVYMFIHAADRRRGRGRPWPLS